MRTIVITLLEYPERKAEAIKHFSEIGMEVEFYEGINAQKFGIKCYRPYMADRKEGDELFYVGEHCNGIFLSHYSLWSALSLMPQEHTLILEIDAFFDGDWNPRLEQAIQDAGDFDWLFIGSCCTKDKPTTHKKGNVYEVKYPACFHAYVLSKKAIPHLLATNRDCYAPIDISAPLYSFKDLNVLTVLPQIAKQSKTELSP